jgi:hypothetical protein
MGHNTFPDSYKLFGLGQAGTRWDKAVFPALKKWDKLGQMTEVPVSKVLFAGTRWDKTIVGEYIIC